MVSPGTLEQHRPDGFRFLCQRVLGQKFWLAWVAHRSIPGRRPGTLTGSTCWRGSLPKGKTEYHYQRRSEGCWEVVNGWPVPKP